MLFEAMPAIGRSAVCYLTSENFPWDEGKPASGRRSICHTTMEMPPFTRARYCVGYWERLSRQQRKALPSESTLQRYKAGIAFLCINKIGSTHY